MRHVLLVAAALCAVSAAGCVSSGYYLQSVRGQIDLLAKREPIAQVIADPATPEQLRERLASVLEMRAFATRELGLPDNRSYKSYADLGRSYVVWNVFAAPELSVEPENWCFPFVGCLAYRGYFSEDDARRYAARLSDAGADVYVAGVVAYSTLGHFADPVLNTMLRGDDMYIAGVLFHELAHQQIYVRGDSEFNEAFASFVEEEGVRRWLAGRGDAESWQRWQQRQQRRERFGALIRSTRERLEAVYASSLSDERKRARKRELIEALRDAHEQMRAELGHDTGYERWFAGPLNNAQLSSVSTYRRYVPAFRGMLERQQGDLDRFFARAAAVGRLAPERRTELMETLLADATRNASGTHAAAEFVEPSAPGLLAE